MDGSGNICVVGTSFTGTTFGSDLAMARLTSQGNLDTSFGSGGAETINFGAPVNSGDSVLVDPTGRIVLVGDSTQRVSGPDFALAELDTQGNLVKTFGTSGKVTSDLGFTAPAAIQQANLPALQQDGRIVVAGTVSSEGTSSDFFVARYNADGTLDSTFGNKGFLLIDFGGTIDNLTGLGGRQSGSDRRRRILAAVRRCDHRLRLLGGSTHERRSARHDIRQRRQADRPLWEWIRHGQGSGDRFSGAHRHRGYGDSALRQGSLRPASRWCV